MKLHDLVPNPGSKKNRKRVGRGISAGQGKTAGRGTKGQGSRTGTGGKLYRQGGNLPFYRKLPFARGVGFTNPWKVDYTPVNLAELAEFPAGTEVTPELLVLNGMVRSPQAAVAILGEGELPNALTVKAHRFSKTAQQKIEAAGGKVEILPFEVSRKHG